MSNKTIINLHELINDPDVIIQVGHDKNNDPLFLGDIVVEEIEQLFSDDYWNGFESNTRYVNPSEPKMHKGKVYRKIVFSGSSFLLDRIKEEGSLPKGTSGTEWAKQEVLDRYIKV